MRWKRDEGFGGMDGGVFVFCFLLFDFILQIPELIYSNGKYRGACLKTVVIFPVASTGWMTVI